MADFTFKGLIYDYIKANPDKTTDVFWHDPDSYDYWDRDRHKSIQLSEIDLNQLGPISYGDIQMYSTVNVYVKLHNDQIRYRIIILMTDIFGFLNGKINQLMIDKEKDNEITFR